MGISWGTRTVTEASFNNVHGQRVLGGYGLSLSIDFHLLNWSKDAGVAPQFRLLDSKVELKSAGGAVVIGYAKPEQSVPFCVGEHSMNRGLLYHLLISAQAMEHLEEARAGGNLELELKLLAEVFDPKSVRMGWSDVRCLISQSDWLVALEGCGYMKAVLFEIPIPTDLALGDAKLLHFLKSARRAFVEGRYTETVANCRDVLDQLTRYLKQQDEIATLRSLGRDERQQLSVRQRELRLRTVAMDYASLAHHQAEMNPDCVFDRSAAQMMLGVASSLASAALGRAEASARLTS
jgi:hypothetical protein